MALEQIKHDIKNALEAFNTGDISASAINLFKKLGYNTDRQAPLAEKTSKCFEELFLDGGNITLDRTKARTGDWKSIDLLFQITNEEVRSQHSLFESNRVSDKIYESYLFFVIELAKDSYSRTDLSKITREINKVFLMPVMLLFKHGNTITLSIINRRLHKKDTQKDVLEKVTLIKDISFTNPHRAHIDILADLSFDELLSKHKFGNFVELHDAWQKTLDTKELNKRFYQDISNWYFWAKQSVSFPDDTEKNEDLRNSTNLIRLITRIIFVWFIREKSLVPDLIFNAAEVGKLLKDFNRDKQSNTYYKAILQNLFFGTLNQKMDDRSFVAEKEFQGKSSSYGVKTQFRYADMFTIGKQEALDIFKDVPFLNGGLFDCLDKENDEGNVVYVDGFSSKEGRQANVPDFLFFANEQDVDLNDTYGTRNKKYRSKGLINILSAYKFTVAENTPIEEEVALDPELLGRVFENLLASYNPETQTTARKQTGSFYTPREIVNYMVDESLKAYLKQKLVDAGCMCEADVNAGLELLFEYTDMDHVFDDMQVRTLIEAIDTCKILDPACGSGAFPMGVLHKLVYILHKIDPNNEQWKERQIKNAYRFEDSAIREHAIADIESAFVNNELDYGRKLFLIENCIYGVDIQPIAVQIAKLRFFISLVVDQRKQIGKDNLGVRSLPNLETKFVAANTLVGLSKPVQRMLPDPEIARLEDELKQLRHQYFGAKNRKDKIEYQKSDKSKRKRISDLLKDNGWPTDSAELVATFDPYDQNTSSSFFDPEWMFGWAGGFDIVISNPPFGARVDIDIKILKVCYPHSISGKIESYRIFIERALQLATYGGIIAYIVPNTWMFIEQALLLRRHILQNTHITTIVSMPQSAFDASVDSMVFLLHKLEPNSEDKTTIIDVNLKATINELDLYLNQKNQYMQRHWLDSDKSLLTYGQTEVSRKLIERIRGSHPVFGDYIYIRQGLIPYLTKEEGIYNKYISESRIDDSWSEYLDGSRCVDRYGLKGQISFIKYGDWLYAPRESAIFKTNRIIYQLIRNISLKRRVIATYLDTKLYTDRNTGLIFVKPGSTLSLLYVLGIFNSCLINYVHARSHASTYISFPSIESLPLVIADECNQRRLSQLVEYLLLQKKMKVISAMFFDRLIDAIVYELYLPDEVQSANCEVLKHIINLPELRDDWGDEQKLQTISTVYQELSDPMHPVSIAMFKMETIEEIRIIEGGNH